jgi:hypothetical protein
MPRHSSLTTTFALRLLIEDNAGNAWTALTDTRTSIVAAAAWREDIRTWCTRNPLPADYHYTLPLPRPIQLPPGEPALDAPISHASPC